ncbi:MAG: cobalamin-dependent protein [Anaerolineae bacterium]
MEIIQRLVQAVQAGEPEAALAAAEEALQAGCEVNALIDELTVAMRQVGERFERMEIFLPGMMLAARAMQGVMARLEQELVRRAQTREKKGVVVLGTVQGDIHEIGKDIVATLLRVHGFEVHDLGADVDALEFVRRAEAVGADIIGASALMTTTMPAQQEIIHILRDKGVRDKYHVAVGGAPVTQEWADEIGADSWGENAAQAVAIFEQVMAERRKSRAPL